MYYSDWVVWEAWHGSLLHLGPQCIFLYQEIQRWFKENLCSVKSWPSFPGWWVWKGLPTPSAWAVLLLSSFFMAESFAVRRSALGRFYILEFPCRTFLAFGVLRYCSSHLFRTCGWRLKWVWSLKWAPHGGETILTQFKCPLQSLPHRPVLDFTAANFRTKVLSWHKNWVCRSAPVGRCHQLAKDKKYKTKTRSGGYVFLLTDLKMFLQAPS